MQQRLRRRPALLSLQKDKVVLPSGAIFALNFFPLQYPRLAKQVQSGGKVEVHVTIDALGHVVKVAGATGPTVLRQPAIDSVSHWLFRPFLFCGEPVVIDADVRPANSRPAMAVLTATRLVLRKNQRPLYTFFSKVPVPSDHESPSAYLGSKITKRSEWLTNTR